MFKHIILSLLVVAPLFGAGKLSDNKIYAPARLGTVSVEHTTHGFMVNNTPVQPQHMDKQLRSITAAKLTTALRSGYIQVDQSCNGQYKLEMQGRLQGGGPITSRVFYWATKSLCYAIGVTAAGTAITTTGGALGAGQATLVAASTLKASAGSTLMSAAIQGAGYSAAATQTATAVVTSAGTFAKAKLFIEALSIGAGAFGAWLPLP